MRLFVATLVLAAAGAALPRVAAAEACRASVGHDGARVLEDHSRRATRMAGSSIAALASFAGLAVTSADEGPVSVGVLDADTVGLGAGPTEASAGARPARGAAMPTPARRIPMCTGSVDDDPRCRPVPPGPDGGPELSRAPLRGPAPRPPAWPGAAAPAARAAAELAETGALRAGVRGRLERPPRR